LHFHGGRGWHTLTGMLASARSAAVVLIVMSANGASHLFAAQRQSITFTSDVAPIVFANCSTCHRPGGSSSFSLLTYDDVKRRAQAIATATRTRYMPPWKPEPGAGEFVDVRRLTDAQIDVFQRWVAQGTAEGDRAQLPPVPVWSSEWSLGKPDLVLTMDRRISLRRRRRHVAFCHSARHPRRPASRHGSFGRAIHASCITRPWRSIAPAHPAGWMNRIRNRGTKD
jgi:hypothetical protein